MRIIEWLKMHAPACQELTDADLEELLGFTLLWSLFEARRLKGEGCKKTIERLVDYWAEVSATRHEPFKTEIEYVLNRYLFDPLAETRFAGLKANNLSNGIRSGFARSATQEEQIKMLFFVIYRWRNNLFHGTKWDYGIIDQRENFMIANSSLMKAIHLPGPDPHL